MKNYRFWIVLGAVILAIAALSVQDALRRERGNFTVLAAPVDLFEDGFEGSFRYVDGQHELLVADGWEPWWDGHAARPEYKRADKAVDEKRVHSGSAAQQWFNNYAKHTAGVYRKVSGLKPGDTIGFEAWLQCFSSNKDDFSQSDGRYRMRIGIDPYGGTNPESPDVVWHHPQGWAIEPYDVYQYLKVETTVRSDRATLFVWGQAEWGLKHNNAYVDDVRAYTIAAAGPTPQPCPTCVPAGMWDEEVLTNICENALTDVLERTELTVK